MRNVKMSIVAGVMLVATLTGAGTARAQAPAGWVEHSIDREVSRLTSSHGAAPFSSVRQQSQAQKRKSGFNAILRCLAPSSGSVAAFLSVIFRATMSLR